MNQQSSRSRFALTDTTLLLLLALVIFAVNALLNGQYGFHRDELDVLMNARQLAWGYVAYPPLTPFIARIGLELFGPSLIGLRLFAALAQGVVAILVGRMALDLGGKRRAMVLAVLAVAISPVALSAGTMLMYFAFDYLLWVLIAFCFVRLLRTEDPRWWLGVGAAIGLAMMNKYTPIFFVAGLVAAVLLTPARRYLKSIWLWAGAGLALLIFLPNAIWQIQHNFIAFDFLSAIHARDIAWGRADGFLLDQLYAANNPFILPLWVAGLVYCFIGQQRFRALAWMFGVTFLLFLVSRGRGYYVAPAYPMLVAAGAVWLEGWIAGLSLGWSHVVRALTGVLMTAGAALGLLLIKPSAPINSGLWNVATSLSDNFVEMVGWPDLVKQVADIANTLTPEERAKAVVVAANYGEAGAVELYGSSYSLPRMISAADSLWERGWGTPDPQIAIMVGFDSGFAEQYFASCKALGMVKNAYGVRNEETRSHNILYLCRQPHESWEKMWPEKPWYQ